MNTKALPRELLARCRSKPGFPHATRQFWMFETILLTIFISAYLYIVNFAYTWPALAVAYVLAYGTVTVLTLSVGHQALHGSLVKNRKINRALGLTVFTLLGIDGVLWRIRHIRDHHPHPNTKGHDADIDNPTLLRLAPYTERRFYHRAQHLYAPLLYSIGTVFTICIDDFRALISEIRNSRSAKNHILRFIFVKGIFLSVWIVGPYLLQRDFSIAEIVTAFAISTIPTGWLFLPIAAAHLNEHTEFYKTSKSNAFVERQAETTVDFSPHSTLMTLIYGGLNCHLAHHLFPSVAACHYGRLYELLERADTASAASQKILSVPELLLSHFQFLRVMGSQREADLFA